MQCRCPTGSGSRFVHPIHNLERGLKQYLIKRLFSVLPTVIGVAVVVFLIVRILPGDPAALMAGPQATEADIEEIRAALGLNRPLPVQFAAFFADLCRGDLGKSLRTGFPVVGEILEVLPNTYILVSTGMIFGMAAGVLLGAISAARQYSWVDHVAMFVAIWGISMPSFWLGLLLIILFSVELGWLPSGGIGTIQHLVLPAASLAVGPMAVIARQTKSSMLEVLRQDYIRTARTKGVREIKVIYKHALKPALIPVITVSGTLFGVFLSGSVIVESVFSYPGLGRMLVDSLLSRDYPLLQGCVLILSLSFIFINLAVDLLYSYIDPRIAYN